MSDKSVRMVCLGFLNSYGPMTVFPEGRDLAKNFGCKFIETSAKTLINVDKAFNELVREIRRYDKVCFIDITYFFL